MEPITVAAPASKSVSHRALMAAALAPGVSTVSGILVSNDTTGATLPCLESMGAEFELLEEGQSGRTYRVSGMANGPRGGGKDAPALLPVSESGTTCRLITGVAAAGNGSFLLRGEGRMHDRPMAGLTDVLGELGVAFDYQEKPGYLPFIMTTRGMPGGDVFVSMEESSQYLSGLLLAAPLAPRQTTLGIAGLKAVSWPYVALTLEVLEARCIDFEVQTRADGGWRAVDWRTITKAEPGMVRFVVRPGRYSAGEYEVEADWSNASYFLAAGAVGPRPVLVTGVRADSLQGDKAIARILADMGAGVEFGPKGVTVTPRPLKGISVDMSACPDLVPTVAMAALFADGPTTISGVAHLRIKESDRIAAVAGAIRAVGSEVDELDDGMVVRPKPLPRGNTVRFETHADHRMAMSFSLLGFGGVTVELDNPGCVAKSCPDFFDRFAVVTGAGESA